MSEVFDFTRMKPPSDAFNIKHEETYILRGNPPKHVRKIYQNVPLTPYELQKIEEFKKYIALQPPIKLPQNWKDFNYLKIIECGKWKNKDGFKCLLQHIEWQNAPLNHSLHSINLPILEKGIMYVNGRDKQHRPIVILNAYLIDLKKKQNTQEQIIQGVSYLLGNVVRHMMIPYHIENWVMIIDTNKMSIFSLPISALGDIIANMQVNFCGRLDKMFILNPSSGLSFSWGSIQSFINPDTANKITFLKSKEFIKMNVVIEQDQLEQKYGGTLPDITSYWPPVNRNVQSMQELEIEVEKVEPTKQNQYTFQMIQIQTENQPQNDNQYEQKEKIEQQDQNEQQLPNNVIESPLVRAAFNESESFNKMQENRGNIDQTPRDSEMMNGNWSKQVLCPTSPANEIFKRTVSLSYYENFESSQQFQNQNGDEEMNMEGSPVTQTLVKVDETSALQLDQKGLSSQTFDAVEYNIETLEKPLINQGCCGSKMCIIF